MSFLKSKGANLAYQFAMTYLGTCACAYLCYGKIHSVGFESFLFFVFLLFSRYILFAEKHLKINIFDLIYGFFGGLLLWSGKEVYEKHTINAIAETPVKSLLLIVGFSAVTITVLKLIDLIFSGIYESKSAYLEKVFNKRLIVNRGGHYEIDIPWICIIFVLIAFILYFSCYLAFYPGIGAYDFPWQTRQALSGSYDNHWPVLHTLFWKFCIILGNGRVDLIKSLAIYAFLQMILVLATYSYTLFWMDKHRYPKATIGISMLYYLLIPTFHIMSINMNMVVFFACTFSLYIMALIDFEEMNSAKNSIKVIVWGILSILLRNNMIFAFAVAVILSIFFIRKITGRRVFIQFLILVILGFAVFRVVFPRMGVGQGSRIAESMSVPCSQLSYVYKYDTDISERDREWILSYVGAADSYNERFADPVKGSFNTSLYVSDRSAFWKSYLYLGIKKPFSYISAFLDLNIQYWYPSAIFVDPLNWNPYIETSIKQLDDYPHVERYSQNENLLNFYTSVASFQNMGMRVPLLYQYFSLSFVFISVYVGLYLAAKKRKRQLFWMYVLMILLFGTYLLGPCALYRYIYSFFTMIPLYIGGLFCDENDLVSK